MAAIDAGADQVYPDLTSMAAWPTLRMHLAILAVAGDDPIQPPCTRAAARHELDTAADAAAVLDWRLDESGRALHRVGPLRWLPAIPAALIRQPRTGPLSASPPRSGHTSSPNPSAHTAAGWDAATAPALGASAAGRHTRLRAEIAVFRAAHDVPEADTRLTGPEQYAVRDRRDTTLLEDYAEQHLGRTATPTPRRFNTLIDDIDPRVRRDPYWHATCRPPRQVARTDVDLSPTRSPTPPPTARCPTKCQARRCGGAWPDGYNPPPWKHPPSTCGPAWLPDLHTRVRDRDRRNNHRRPRIPAPRGRRRQRRPLPAGPPSTCSTSPRPPARRQRRTPPLPFRPDEYALLLTYSIDLFASHNPYDHIDIPVPTTSPQRRRTRSTHHRYPDPEHPLDLPEPHTGLSDDAMLDKLGLGYGGRLIPPGPDRRRPARPTRIRRPRRRRRLDLRRPAYRAPADPPCRRRAGQRDRPARRYHQAAPELRSPSQTSTHRSKGPRCARPPPRIGNLRRRADARPPLHDRRPRRHRRLGRRRRQLRGRTAPTSNGPVNNCSELEAQPDADPLDIASGQTRSHASQLAVPTASPAERYQRRLERSPRRAARTPQEGQPTSSAATTSTTSSPKSAAKITRPCSAARRRVEQSRPRTRPRRNRHRRCLRRSRNPQRRTHFGQVEALHTETGHAPRGGRLRVDAGSRSPPTPPPPARPDRVSHHRSRRAAASPSPPCMPTTTTPPSTRCMSCTPAAAAKSTDPVVQPQRRRPPASPDPDAADSVSLGRHTNRSQRPTRTGRSDHHRGRPRRPADPRILTDLAEHAAENRARLVLVDGDEHGWPPAPSAPLLKLLQRDLPWSGVLSTTSATPARRLHQPDRDPVLEQADRCNPNILPTEVTEALAERARLHTQHNTSYRVHTEIWRQMTDPAHHHATGRER